MNGVRTFIRIRELNKETSYTYEENDMRIFSYFYRVPRRKQIAFVPTPLEQS